MKSYPTADEVLADIGEKTVEAFTRAVKRTTKDLRTYRIAFPQFVADHSERGLANWISDRLWAHLTSLAESVPGMEVTESGPLREIVIGVNYRFRVKRHNDEGQVASYPTPLFLEFVCQPTGQLPGMEETRLIAGYIWDADIWDLGDPVISLRDGEDNIIWQETLPDVEDTGGGVAPIMVPQQPGPTSPTVDIPDRIGQKGRESAEGE